MSKKKDWTNLLDTDFFKEDKWSKKSSVETTVIISKMEEMKKRLVRTTPQQQLKYKEQAVHLFPEHPKAPYIGDGAFSDYPVNIAYTANFILDLKAEIKGEKRCSEESLLERKYIAVIAKAKIEKKHDPAHLEAIINSYENLIAPHIAEKYGLDEEYVRKGLLNSCALAMIDGFTKEPKLLNIYNQTLSRNGT